MSIQHMRSRRTHGVFFGAAPGPVLKKPVTRAKVEAEVLQLEQNGYNPAAALDAQYPADIQAAETRVAAQHATGQHTSGYGSPMAGSSQTGPGQHPMVVNPDGQ
ncbi:DUF4148 domain-containing protein [Paraburkholderia sp. JPY169]|uniref:DUF4148 domain-containing protein n=1 Tax=Paraburkholderia youngii TaxID=2782701 RepID=A0A7Y6K828_9BURK|nr:DUF4148 domain-containing protein [Paraburkholderia youngii]